METITITNNEWFDLPEKVENITLTNVQRIRVKIITGDNVQQYERNLNKFFEENRNIEVIDIRHMIRRIDDYIGFITYKEPEIE